MDVTYFVRSRTPGQYSLERVLENLIAGLGERVHPRVYRARSGIHRLPDAIGAVFAQGVVNHIAGHVHHLAIVLSPRKTVMTVHDVGHLSNVRPAIRPIYKFLWYDVPISRVAAVIAVSDFTRREILRVVGAQPRAIRVIHDCVPAGFEPAPAHFDADRPTILVVGTAPHKNAGRLVQAVEGLGCRILFVGRVLGVLRDALESTGVEFEERVDVSEAELAECYRRSDVVYFASTYEGFGLPIVEAQAVGRPVITSRVCSMPEVAGDGAFLVDPYDVSAIRRALLALFGSADLRAELVGKGLENVKRFDRAAFADAHLDVYRHVAS